MQTIRTAVVSTAPPELSTTQPDPVSMLRRPSGVAVSASRPDHRNNFNLIRLLAALQVLVVHIFESYDFKGPIIEAVKVIPGVPTFYFISGYLIYTAYQRTSPRGVQAFFANRFLRIYPGLWVCMGVSVLSVALTGYFHSHPATFSHFVVWLGAQSTFFQFYNPSFMRGYGVGVLNGSVWTIAVELQFYILTPLLFYFLHSRRGLFWGIFAASLAANLYVRFYFNWDLLGLKLFYTSFAPWIYMFMAGFLAAHFVQATERLKKIPYIALVAGLLTSQLFIGAYAMNASNGISPISYGIVAILILKFSTQKIAPLKSFQQFVAQEDFSYGIYLYHMPIINILMYESIFSSHTNAIVVLPGTVLAAALSWFFVEKPSLRHKQ